MHLSPWGRVVAISALLVGASQRRRACGRAITSSEPRLVTYPVTGTVEGWHFDVADGDIVIVGGGDSIDVRRSKARYSFAMRRRPQRAVDGAVLACARAAATSLLGPCSMSCRVTVPDNVALDIRTTSGDVSLRGYRGSARIATGSGAIGSPLLRRLARRAVRLRRHRVRRRVRSPAAVAARRDGSIHATLPPGRYDLDAEQPGRSTVRGSRARRRAYSVQILSAQATSRWRPARVIAALELERLTDARGADVIA